MHRFIIALSLVTTMASTLPALAGPNGASPSPSFFPVQQRRIAVARKPAPQALLGDASMQTDSVRALRPGVMGKHPTRTFQRRPSEGK